MLTLDRTIVFAPIDVDPRNNNRPDWFEIADIAKTDASPSKFRVILCTPTQAAEFWRKVVAFDYVLLRDPSWWLGIGDFEIRVVSWYYEVDEPNVPVVFFGAQAARIAFSRQWSSVLLASSCSAAGTVEFWEAILAARNASRV